MLLGSFALEEASLMDSTKRTPRPSLIEEGSRQLLQRCGTALVVSRGIGEQVEIVNDTFTRLFGYTIEDMPDVAHWWPLAYPDEAYRESIKANWQTRVAKAIANQSEIEPMEAKVRCKDGSERFIEFHFSTIGDAHLVSFVDLTERKRAEIALRESEEKFRSVFRDSGVGMVIVSLEGRFLAANRTFCDFLGYREQELLEKTVESITLAHDWPAFSQRLQQCLANGNSFQWFEKRCLHKTGQIVYTQSSASLIRGSDGAPQYFVGEVLDVTKRNQAEETLAGLTRKLIDAQEYERARIGRELHDDIGQRLAMLALELEELQKNPSEAVSRAQQLRSKMIEISSDVQALSHELHSSKLEYLGVVKGLQGWCREVAQRQGVEIDFTSEVSSILPREIGICFFRVLQEALHNAVKYSGANRIDVKLRENSNEVHLIIHDSGTGFDVEAAMQGNGLGLTSMQERIRLLNGIISIQSRSGGTTIHARVPFSAEHDSQRPIIAAS